MKKTGWLAAGSKAVVILVSVSFLPSFDSFLLAQDPVDRVETWDGGTVAGWKRKDTLNGSEGALANSGSALRLVFPAQAVSFPAVDLAYADGSASQGRFTGDYSAVARIRFRLYCESYLPAQARLYIESGMSGRRWYHSLSGLATGQWADVDIPMEYGCGWRTGTDPTEAKFEADIRSVAWVGVRLQRNGSTETQAYGLDDFALEGGGGAGRAALPAWWIERYFGPAGAGGAGLSGADTDGDGMDNAAEYVAGTDPTRGDSVLAMAAVATSRTGSGGILIQWKSVTNRWYTIDRATNLADGFCSLESNIPGTPPLNVFEDATATNSGPCFYRIRVE